MTPHTCRAADAKMNRHDQMDPDDHVLPIDPTTDHVSSAQKARADRGVPRRWSRRGYLRTSLATAACAAPKLGFGLGMSLLGCVGGLWAFLSLRFSVPNGSARDRLRFRAGRLEEFAEEGVHTRFRDSHGVWIVCLRIAGTRRLMAYRATCTHLGCLTLWSEADGEFHCPCHGSAFNLAGGNLRGPAPRPLDLCAIRATGDGYVEIDASRVFRRGAGQALPSDTYVLV